VVVGTASSTKYSVMVTARYAATALPIVDDLIQKCREMQNRLPKCLTELEVLSESLRLAERKLVVCDKMIAEAETESAKSKTTLIAIGRRLEQDDIDMTLLESERKEYEREMNIVEVEYAQWATVYNSRNKERDDIKEGIKMMHHFQRDRQKEKNRIKEELEINRHDLPSCIAALRNFTEAANVAASLNTVVQGPSAAMGLAAVSDAGAPTISTPADDVRRNMKREGFKGTR
jgi:chromosome segregation ATPase